MSHHHAARVARQARGRFYGNVRAVLEDRLAGLIGVCEDLGIDVGHDLVALDGGAGVDAAVKGRLREHASISPGEASAHHEKP